jgi:hypothetical protein
MRSNKRPLRIRLRPHLQQTRSMEGLTKLKGLLDSGVLTQDEFDVQKQKVLQSM